MFHTKHSKPVRSYHYLSPRWFTGRIKITLRFSILFALFHVKLPNSDPCSVALLMFHMKLYQASTSLATFHIAFSHEVIMSHWDFLSPRIVHVKQSNTYHCSLTLLLFHIKLYHACTCSTTFHIAGSHELLMITLWFSILFALFHVKQSETYPILVTLLMFHMKHF